jgi:hypothetical protein
VPPPLALFTENVSWRPFITGEFMSSNDNGPPRVRSRGYTVTPDAAENARLFHFGPSKYSVNAFPVSLCAMF